MVVSVQPFLEPRGFIRGLEFVFSIAAFATVSNFGSWFGFDYFCPTPPGTKTEIRLPVSYPFGLAHSPVKIPVCGKEATFRLAGDFRSDAQFFVATGVLSMIWTMVAAAVYLLADQAYRADKRIKFVDFGVTLLLATFWIAGSAAWANGLRGLNTVTDPATYIEATSLWAGNGLDKNNFKSFGSGNFSSLTISVLLGFLNFILWAGNSWFLYKEIKDEEIMGSSSQQQTVPPATVP